MKILHVVTGMRKASGVTTFVENLVAELKKRGIGATVAMKDADFTPCDVVHVHGLWSPLLHRASRWARHKNIPVVWSPHGMLQKWALKNKWWKKFVALALYQWRDLHSAAFLHATAQSEVEDIRRLKLKNKVVVAPLGVRIPDGDEGLGRRPTADVKTLLFVSRVQRKKGLPNLVEAWSRLKKVEVGGLGLQRTGASLIDGWTIRIVGPDQDNHTAELKSQCDRLGLTYSDGTDSTVDLDLRPRPNVIFTGPKYDSDLDAEYSNADLFVLPTHSENFGSVVIEALAHSVPVITTKEAPWSELEEFKCGWWIEDNVDALTWALKEALSLHCTPTPTAYPSLARMGENGRALVEERYTWSAVCDKMLREYEDLLK